MGNDAGVPTVWKGCGGVSVEGNSEGGDSGVTRGHVGTESVADIDVSEPRMGVSA